MTPAVTYDGRSLHLHGKRLLLLSGAIHYPRSTPAMWPRLLRESREAGLNCIETYVFWEGHEPREGEYCFEERFDLGRFLDACHEAGLHVILRVGPYICAEWNFGGLPAWLVTKPGMITRTANAPFQEAMGRWVQELWRRVGDRQITKGGPVILVQMENEYNNVAARYGDDGRRYLAWCVDLARQVGVEVPLVMCEGAPAGTLETLNGFSVWRRVDKLRDECPHQPALWTENWPGLYDVWGQPHRLRRASEVAYETLRFVAHGGTGINYYMWHGGTNFDRDAMFLQTTSYDFDAPLDEYGLPTDKSRHLARLHRALQRIAPFLLHGERLPREVLHAGEMPQNADGVLLYPYRHGGREIAFLISGNDWPQKVRAWGLEILLPTRAGVILERDKERARIAYRTWDAPTPPIRRVMKPKPLRLSWRMVAEPMPEEARFHSVRLPHNMLHDTHDETDFGWYRAMVRSPRTATARLSVAVADFLAVWINGVYLGASPKRFKENRERADFTQTLEIPLRRGANEILLLVTAMGLIKGDWMIGAPQSEEAKGLLGPVRLDGRIVRADWKFAAGLWGEEKRIAHTSAPAVTWRKPSAKGSPLRWYQASFKLASAELKTSGPWALDAGGLQRGRFWMNGHGLGRYWQAPACNALESDIACHPHLLVERMEQPVQRWYHVPPDWLRAGTNVLTICEEEGAPPDTVGLVRRH